MTDEEMAEEWAKENMDCVKTVSYLNHDCNYFSDEERCVAKSAYLAGLKAGKDMAETDLATIAYMQGAERYRPKWHKVADGDLPPEDTDVLALLADKEIYMAHFYRRNVWDKIGPVIAWCEIPRYTEE